MTKETLLDLDSNGAIISHYTTREVAIEKILPTGKLLLNSIKNSNDPREYKKRVNGVYGKNEESGKFFEVLDKDEENLTKTMFFCGSITKENESKLIKRASFGNSKMWAEYGESHKGVCLIFDKEKLIKQFDKQFNNKPIFDKDFISYEEINKEKFVRSGSVNDELLKINETQNVLIDFYKHNREVFFFSKDYCWSTENEFRFLIISEKEDVEFLEYKDALLGIILGENCNPIYGKLINKYGHIFKMHMKSSRRDINDYQLIENQRLL